MLEVTELCCFLVYPSIGGNDASDEQVSGYEGQRYFNYIPPGNAENKTAQCPALGQSSFGNKRVHSKLTSSLHRNANLFILGGNLNNHVYLQINELIVATPLAS